MIHSYMPLTRSRNISSSLPSEVKVGENAGLQGAVFRRPIMAASIHDDLIAPKRTNLVDWSFVKLSVGSELERLSD